MSTRFQEYIENRIVNHKAISVPEKHVLEVIDRFDIGSKAVLIYVDDVKFEIYDVAINGSARPSRFHFDGVGKEIPHRLGELFQNYDERGKQYDCLFVESREDAKIIFDSYFNKFLDIDKLLNEVNNEISNLNLNVDDHIILVNGSNVNRLLRYAFQQKAKRIVCLEPQNEQINIKGRIEIANSLSSNRVNIIAPMNTVLGLMLNKNNIFIPLCEDTLDSLFYKGISWRKLLGNFANTSQSDIYINHTPCRVLKITPVIDAFGNLFINIYSILENRGVNRIIDGPGKTMSESAERRPKRNKPQTEETSKPQVKKTESISSQRAEPKKRKEGSFRQNTSIDDEIVLFDKSSYPWKNVEQRLADMQITEVESNIKRLNEVFDAIYSCDRIVTDTNLWMTEYPVGSRQMAYLKLIEFITGKFVEGRNQVFEIIPEVYEEINKHDRKGVAASHKAKAIIGKYQAKDLVDLRGLTFEQNPKAYADTPLGYHILDLLTHGVKFAVLTNDEDASIRWRQNIKDENTRNGSNDMPPIMLCRNLQKLFELRGKLIVRKKELKNSKR